MRTRVSERKRSASELSVQHDQRRMTAFSKDEAGQTPLIPTYPRLITGHVKCQALVIHLTSDGPFSLLCFIIPTALLSLDFLRTLRDVLNYESRNKKTRLPTS